MALGIIVSINTIILILSTLFITKQLNKMAKTQAEVAAELVALKEQVVKIKGEVAAKLQALADAIANQGNASPEVEAALADLKTTVQEADDLNEDATVTPTEPTV